MFKFLILVICLFFLFGFLFGFSVLRLLFKSIFGIQSAPQKPSSNQQKTKQSSRQTKTPPSAKKIITRDEGEYVDFEEIKDS